MSKRRLLALALALLLSAAHAGAAPAPSLALFELTATYARGTFPRKASWLGLFCDKAGCALKPAQVRIKNGITKDIEDADEKTDVVEVDDSPLSVFAGTTLASGKVETWYQAEHTTDSAAAGRHLRTLGKWTMPGGVSALTLSWVRLPEDKGFRYHLSDGVTKQFLFAVAFKGDYGGDTQPIIHWVGDLDHDGKMDMLIGLSNDCRYDQRLYLSTLAGKGEFVAKAAQLSGMNAACGC